MFSFSCDPTSLYHNQGVPGSGRLDVARAGRDRQPATAVSCLTRQDPSVPNGACVKVLTPIPFPITSAFPSPLPLPSPIPIPNSKSQGRSKVRTFKCSKVRHTRKAFEGSPED